MDTFIFAEKKKRYCCIPHDTVKLITLDADNLGKEYMMKTLGTISLALLAFVMLAACGPSKEIFASENYDDLEETENNNDNMENNTITLTVNGHSFTATLVENSSTDALKKHLAQGSISVRMDDYGDMEKVGSLGFSLPRNDVQTTTVPGDLILYQGNSFVIYYDTNSWNFTRLGKVDGISTREQMLELLGGKGEIILTLSLK